MGSSQSRFHTSTALVRARETVERFAERLTSRKKLFHVIVPHVCARIACGVALGCFRRGGIVGVTSMTRLVENEELVKNILNDGVTIEPYYIALRAD